MIDHIPNPARDRLAALVSLAEKRVARAAVKRRAAECEMSDALDALEAANARLAECTDPQFNLLALVA
jgi:hypothetical protein